MTAKQNGHKHGPCERCGIEQRRSDAMRRVLEDGGRVAGKILAAATAATTVRDVELIAKELRIWAGRARRAVKGQSVYSEAGR